MALFRIQCLKPNFSPKIYSHLGTVQNLLFQNNVRLYSVDKTVLPLYQKPGKSVPSIPTKDESAPSLPLEEEKFEYTFAKRLISDSRLYKGLAFTNEERDLFHLRGLLPPAIMSLENQLAQFSELLDNTGESGLTKFVRVMGLYDLNKRLFFKFVELNFERIVRTMYTPFIPDVCVDYSLVFSRPRVLYITINDRGNVAKVLGNWPHKDIMLIIVTEGEKVYGLGDLGVNGAPVCVGKHVLYSAVSGLNPHSCLPVVIDVGTNNETYLKDRLYNGLRQKRVTGEPYDELMDEFMCSVREVFGPRTVVHMEDFGRANAFRLLQRYKDCCCCFNNDLQSIAAVIVSGIFTGAKILGRNVWDLRFVFFGAGDCNLGIGRLLRHTLLRYGVSEEDVLQNLHFVDTAGLVTRGRQWGSDDPKLPFARDLEPMQGLLEIIKRYKPDVLIGASTVAGAFSEEILETMTRQVEMPLIFALSNPVRMSECTAEEAIRYTDGRCIFASGFPFKPVEYKGVTHYTAQANSCYINTMGMAAHLAGIKSITDEMLLKAACALTECVTAEDIKAKLLYPPLSKIREAAMHVMVELMQYAYDNDLATVFPEPKDKKQYYLSHVYQTTYRDLNFYKNMYDTANRLRTKKQ